MPSVNLCVLVGHVTRDPQVKYTPSNTAIAEFGLAMNRKWKTPNGEQREEVCFVDCTAFGNSAETLAKYVQKGDPLYVQGRLKLDQWDDKQSGAKRSKLSVIVDQFQFLKGRDDAGGQHDPAPPRQRQPSRGPSQRPAAQGAPFGDEQVFNDEDVPFGHMLPERWI